MESGTYQLPKTIERYLAALSKLYELDGNRELQELIVNAQVRVHENSSFDNWNGGITGHALYLVLPENLFLRSVSTKDEIQESIKIKLNTVHNVQNEFIELVFLEMEVTDEHDWRLDSGLLATGNRQVSETAQDRIWPHDGFRLFLSHKSEYKKETGILKEKLNHFGITCFVAHEDIHPSQAWQDEIENALTTMDGFVALMTPDFNESKWTDQEVGFAFARGVPRIAVMLGKKPYGFMGKFQGLKSSWDDAAGDIAGVLITSDRMFSAYLGELKKCYSFDCGNFLGKLLPNIIALSTNQIDELVAVYNENSELRGAFAFNGSKPLRYGPGLLELLNKLGKREFRRNDEWLIELAPS